MDFIHDWRSKYYTLTPGNTTCEIAWIGVVGALIAHVSRVAMVCQDFANGENLSQDAGLELWCQSGLHLGRFHPSRVVVVKQVLQKMQIVHVSSCRNETTGFQPAETLATIPVRNLQQYHYDGMTPNTTNQTSHCLPPARCLRYRKHFTQVFSLVGFILWIRRLRVVKEELQQPMTLDLWIRAMISAAIDADEPFYTIISFSAFSFLFLGGLQLDYSLALTIMLVSFAVTSLGDVVRVILALRSAKTLSDATASSRLLASSIRKSVISELRPTNVYEDLGRGRTIVFMVFVTQAILIAFVVRLPFGLGTTYHLPCYYHAAMLWP